MDESRVLESWDMERPRICRKGILQGYQRFVPLWGGSIVLVAHGAEEFFEHLHPARRALEWGRSLRAAFVERAMLD